MPKEKSLEATTDLKKQLHEAWPELFFIKETIHIEIYCKLILNI